MTIKIIDAGRKSETWRKLFQRLPSELRDLYFTPEWALLHCLAPGSRARLFAVEEDEMLWLNAFIQTPIGAIGRQDVREEKRCDIETPYGYGGPLANTESIRFLAEARRSFASWCRGEGIIAEFIRFHPLLGTERFLGGDAEVNVVDDRQTVLIDLAKRRKGESGYGKDVQYMIRRASRLGLDLVRPNPEELFDRFVALYAEKMRDLAAAEYYFFNEAYFAALADLTSRCGCLIAARDPRDDTWVAAAVFLGGERFLHYHLSASAANRKLPGVTNWIIEEAVRYGMETDLSALHLGGGRTSAPDDSLFRFKRAMGDRLLPFKIGRCVHDQPCYDRFQDIWVDEGGSRDEANRRLLAYRLPCLK